MKQIFSLWKKLYWNCNKQNNIFTSHFHLRTKENILRQIFVIKFIQILVHFNSMARILLLRIIITLGSLVVICSSLLYTCFNFFHQSNQSYHSSLTVCKHLMHMCYIQLKPTLYYCKRLVWILCKSTTSTIIQY